MLQVTFPATDSRGNKHPRMVQNARFRATEVSEESPGRWAAYFDYDGINRVLTAQNVKTTWDVVLKLRYRIAADAGAPDEEETVGAATIDGDEERSGPAEE